MTDLKTLGCSDFFFDYGTGRNDVMDEIAHDIATGLIQSKRSLFYDRSDGVGLQDYENTPGNIVSQLLLKFDIVSWAGRRNDIVVNGQDGYPDKRIAVSQSSIDVVADGEGNLDVEVNYIVFSDTSKLQQIILPAGVR